ncbi:MAG: hypothetical protein AB1489_39135 [Acidobacteriota bacterium]
MSATKHSVFVLSFEGKPLTPTSRVSRLMSHAMALQAGIGAHGLWSV